MTDAVFSACMKQMQAGDMDGLKSIYEAYLPMIYHGMLDVVRVKEIAEDLAADFFVKLYNIRDSFAGGAHRKWMLTIARNMALDYLRKYRRESLAADMEHFGNTGELSGELTGLALAVQEKTVNVAETDVYDGVVDRLAILQAMQVLSAEELELVHLKLMAELKFKEIAELLDMPQGTVSWKYQKALEKLREALRDA